MKKTSAFWQTTALADMTRPQWESLCDGCALCCLHKLEDEDDGAIYYTDVACRLLDVSKGPQNSRCTQYANRANHVPSCIVLTPANLGQNLHSLPNTCAYKRLAQQEPLPEWHPLLTGDPNSTHAAGASIRGRCVSEQAVKENEMFERVIHWVDGFRD